MTGTTVLSGPTYRVEEEHYCYYFCNGQVTVQQCWRNTIAYRMMQSVFGIKKNEEDNDGLVVEKIDGVKRICSN